MDHTPTALLAPLTDEELARLREVFSQADDEDDFILRPMPYDGDGEDEDPADRANLYPW